MMLPSRFGVRTRIRIAGLPLALFLAAQPANAAAPSGSPYTPYAFLVGEWDVGPAGQAPGARTSVTWGPNHSYLWFATSLLAKGEAVPHFEGMLMWNGVRKLLDMLLTLDMNSGRVQEQGQMFLAPDGTVVRDITAIYSAGTRMADGTEVGPEGATAKFRQTFKPVGPDAIRTTLMRKTAAGWAPTFPGADDAIMKRRFPR